MTISGIGSTSNPFQTSTANNFNQLFSDFKGIGGAIQSGDLTNAQNALTTFQNDLQSSNGRNPLSRLFNNNSTLSNDLQTLQTALQSNDATGAQNAFKTLVQDMQSAMKTQGAHRHHHHQRVDNDGDNDSQTSGSTQASSGGDTDGDSSSNATTVGSALDAQA